MSPNPQDVISPSPNPKILDKDKIDYNSVLLRPIKDYFFEKVPDEIDAESPLGRLFYNRKYMTPVPQPSNDRLNAISPMLKQRMNININRKNR